MFTRSVRLHDRAIVQINCATMARYLMKNRVVLKHVLHAQQQLTQVKGLRKKFLRADFKSFESMLSRAQRSHKHDRQRSALFDMTRQFESRTIRQTDIEYHQIP